MLEYLMIALTPLVGILTLVIVLAVGFMVSLLKSQSALTIAGLSTLVSPPVAVGVLGTGLVIAMFTAGEVQTFVALILAAIMTILTFRSNSAATAARESRDAAREAAAAAAENAIELAKISRSVDGVASRQVDKVTALEARITDLLAQLAAANTTASTLAATQAAVAVATAVPASVPKVEP